MRPDQDSDPDPSKPSPHGADPAEPEPAPAPRTASAAEDGAQLEEVPDLALPGDAAADDGLVDEARLARTWLHSLEGRRGLVVLVTGLVAIGLVLARPELIVRVAGVSVAAVALVELSHLRGSRERRRRRLAIGLAGLVAGGALVLVPRDAVTLLGYVLAAAILGHGIWRAYRIPSGRVQQDGTWQAILAFLWIAVGLAFAVLPALATFLSILSLSLLWVASALITTFGSGRRSDRLSEMLGENASPYEVVRAWLKAGEVTPEERAALVERVTFEGADRRTRLQRFATLLAISVVISTLAVLQDSTAVVIGAMLIAPLMTPIMGTAVSVISGRPGPALRSFAVVLGGVTGAIGLSWILAAWVPEVPSLFLNPQITSRTAPTTIDLLIALAAGTGGAYALVRSDVSDSLPGVAIAVALVPPLTVVGITLDGGEYALAWGAFLLFTTNLVSIILAASVIFVITGIAPLEEIRRRQREIRGPIALVLATALLVAIPLVTSGQGAIRDSLAAAEVEKAVTAWLGDGGLRTLQIEVKGGDVLVTVSGPSQPPPVSQLAASLQTVVKEQGMVEVRWIQEDRKRQAVFPLTPGELTTEEVEGWLRYRLGLVTATPTARPTLTPRVSATAAGQATATAATP